MKIEDGKYEGNPDDLLKFFNGANLDISSLLNVPRNFTIPTLWIWFSGIIYILSLLGNRFLTHEVILFLSNLISIISLVTFCVILFIKIKDYKITSFIFIVGVILYLFSTKLISNIDINTWTRKGIENQLKTDSINDNQPKSD